MPGSATRRPACAPTPQSRTARRATTTTPARAPTPARPAPAPARIPTPAQPRTNGTPWDDNSACTRTDTCEAGTCTGTNPVSCTVQYQCHDVGTCNPSTGTCSNPAKPNGATCDDDNACTRTDACQAGICTVTNP